MATVGEAEPVTKPRYSPERVLQDLKKIPEEKRTFSASNLVQALSCQLEALTAMEALRRRADSATMHDFNHIIVIFLKNLYNLVSALPGALMFDALEDVMARSGILAPFVNGMAKVDETVVLELGLPSNDTALCDNHEELIRVAAAAAVCFYHYTNYPAHPAYFPSDDATLLFTSLALRSCQDRAAAQALAEQLQGAGGGLVSLGEIRWLMHYFRAQLSGLGGAVFLSLGDTENYKKQLVAQQADFLGLLKAVPENPAGYSYYVRSCLQFQQLSAAGLFAGKGAVVAEKHKSPLYGAQLAAQRAIALTLAGGGGAAGEVSVAAAKAAAKMQAMAEEPPAPAVLVSAGELRSLMTIAREGLVEEQAQLPEVYGDLLMLDAVDEQLLSELLGPLLEGIPEGGDVLALSDRLYPTRPPASLPRGAVSIVKP